MTKALDRNIARTLTYLLIFTCLNTSCDSDQQVVDNTETDALFNLGRHLFYERRLSLNEDRACGICHEQAKGFTDGFVRAVGTTGEIHPRNTLTLLNTSSRHRLGWLDQNLESVSEHMLIPLLGTDPVEMGMNGRIHQTLETLSREAVYIALINELNHSEKRLGLELMQLALETFIMEVVTYDSPYDRFLQGETNAISAAAKRGADLFFSADMPCTGCHGGDDFDRRADGQHGWFNTGLYELGESRYPAGREGLFERTGRFDDIGRYRTPTLRHLALTAPYYHDGTGATLGDVLKNYNAGGRITSSGPNVGDGRMNRYKDHRIEPLGLSEREIKDLEAFLLSLTDMTVLDRAEWSDPWSRRTD